MGSAKRNLLTSILLLVVMGVFAVLTIFIVVDAINKKYYNDIKVEYEVQEESPNIILTFARNEGSNFSTDDTKVVLSEDNKKFRIDGTVPTIEDGVVTNLDDLTSSDGREFYFFSTNSSFIDPQEDPENPDFIFSKTDSRYYVSTEDNPIWYNVPKSSENLTLYSVFLTPNVHNSDFANAPLLNTSPNVIISHDVVDIPYNAFSDLMAYAQSQGQTGVAKIESVVIPNSTKSINSEVDENMGGGAFAACTTLTDIIIPGSVEEIGGDAFMLCTGLDTVKYGNGYYLSTENNEHAVLIDTNLKAENVTIHEDCVSIQGNTFSKFLFFDLGLMPPPDVGDGSNIEEILGDYTNINLQEISIPKNVKNIGMYAFRMCIGLENVVFEEDSDLTSIGAYSFNNCSSLKTINLEDTKLEEIGSSAFSYCSSLTFIIIPDSVTSIGSYAFYYCSSLTTITIPSNVTSIGERAFNSCSSLETVDFGDNSQLTSIEGSAFENCSSLESVDFGEGSKLTGIGNRAFDRCTSLTSIAIPSLVMSIGEYAFYNCSSLKIVTFGENSILTSIGERAFYDCSSLTSITIPNSVTSIGEWVFCNCSSLKIVTFGENSILTSIGERAFYDCSSLTSITIPDSVTSIGNYAFIYCTNIQKLYIDDLTSYLNISYGNYASRPLNSTNQAVSLYVGEELITNLEIPSEVTAIPSYVFRRVNITGVTIPSSVTSIGGSAFEYCSSLTSITIPSGVTNIGGSAFEYCSSLTSITIPSGVTNIGSNAFRYCYRLVEVYDLTGSEGLNITAGSVYNGYVGYYAVEIKKEKDLTGIYYTRDNKEYIMYEDLNGNHYLVDYQGQGVDITLPIFDDSRTYSIKSYALFHCDSLTSVTIPKSVTSIGNSAFRDCSGLTSITIPDSVTSIGEHAFDDCSSLTSITIPDSVTSIGWSAFSDCSSLTIYCEASSPPSGWDSSWNSFGGDVYWAGEWEMVDGVPTPIESGVEGVGYSDIGEDFGIGFDGLGFREELYFNDKRERKVV